MRYGSRRARQAREVKPEIPGEFELYELKAAPLRVLAAAYGIEYRNKEQAANALSRLRGD